MASFLTIVNGMISRLAAIVVSAGAADADKLVATDSAGQVDNSLVKWAAPGAIGSTTRNTIQATTIDASAALTATAYAKISGAGGGLNTALETVPSAYGNAHIAFTDPVSSVNASLKLIHTGLRAYGFLMASGASGTLLFSNSSVGGFQTTFQSNQSALSTPVTLANVNAAIGYGAQFNFQLGDGTTLYNSGGVACVQSTAFTSTLSTQNAYVAFSTIAAGAVAEKVRISSAGNLMIGTTNDDGNRLQISGNLYASGSISLFGSNLNASSSLAINASVASSKQLVWRAANLNRWNLFTQGAGETGNDAGSPLILSYYTDAGGYKGDVFNARRSDGAITFSTVATFSNTTASVGSTTGAIVVSGGAGIAGAINNPGMQVTIAGALQTQGVGLGTVVGNVRGAGAVDLQTVRTIASQVASGSYATLLGGSGNTAPGLNSALSGGANNSTNGSYSSLSGGQLNAASSNFASVGGGTGNTASANAATIPGGQFAVANRPGQFSYSGGKFAVDGDAQYDLFVLRRQTIDATATELFLDGSGATSRITIANNSSLAYSICISAHSITDRTKQAVFNRRGKIYKLTTAASTAILAGEIQENQVGALAWTATVSADITNGSLKISVVGDASNTINWVATVQAVEVTG